MKPVSAAAVAPAASPARPISPIGPARHIGLARRVLIAPHVSEKASGLEPSGTYTFLVRDDATKTLVKEEVERRYKVRVRRVNIVRKHGASRFFRGRRRGGKIAKKALVTLASGTKIELK